MSGVTAAQLRRAEEKFKRDYAASEGSRARRNQLVRAATAEGWTLQQIADATGLSVSRIGQITKGATDGS